VTSPPLKRIVSRNQDHYEVSDVMMHNISHTRIKHNCKLSDLIKVYVTCSVTVVLVNDIGEVRSSGNSSGLRIRENQDRI
jgi:hypothetical protein